MGYSRAFRNACALAAAAWITACEPQPAQPYDDTELRNRVEALEGRLASIETTPVADVAPAPTTAKPDRIELVQSGSNGPGRMFSSVEKCEAAKARLAASEREQCPENAYCIPYERTCILLN